MLPEATRLGAVYLTVQDLDRSIEYYERSLGMQTHWRRENEAGMGAGEADLIVLKGDPSAIPLQAGQTGLYHYAILVPNRQELAHVIMNFSRTDTVLQGAADHDVSEALYLADPDHNGIEIYRDRPRDEWEYIEGTLKMGTYQLDLNDIVRELVGVSPEWQGLDPATTIGHVHLHVRDVMEAEQFYGTVLGFDLMTRYGSQASFMSVGGYHHHLGLNVWAGQNAPPPPSGSAGLRWFEIIVPDQEAVEVIVSSLRMANVSTELRETGIFFKDPSQNGILLRTA